MKKAKQIGKTLIGAIFALVMMLVTTVSVSAAPLMDSASLGPLNGWAFVFAAIIIGIFIFCIPRIIKKTPNQMKFVIYLVGTMFIVMGVFSTVDFGLNAEDSTAQLVDPEDTEKLLEYSSKTGTNIAVDEATRVISTMVVCNATDDSVRPYNGTAMNVTEPSVTFTLKALPENEGTFDGTEKTTITFSAEDPGKCVISEDGDTYRFVSYDSSNKPYINFTYDGTTYRQNGKDSITLGSTENITFAVDYDFAQLANSKADMIYNIPFKINDEQWTFTIKVIDQLA